MMRWSHVSRRVARGSAVLLCLALALPLATPKVARAQAAAPTGEYVIGIEDVLQVSVWAHPELERTVNVGPQGTIIFPPIGEIKATGLTARQLSDRIADRLSTYLRQGVSTVTVIVRDHLSQSVYVTGNVSRPGRYGAETPLSIFSAINEAGGAQTNGDLSRVTIIRRAGTGPHQFTVDVAKALREGTTASLPALMAGDMVIVPASVSLVGGAGNEEAVGVLGEVNRPGLYPVSTNEDLWVALALAGGPTGRGNLSNVRVLTRDQSAQTAVSVNLLETLQRGNKAPFIVHPGDIVFVDTKGISFWQGFTELLGVTRDAANLVAVVRVLQNNP